MLLQFLISVSLLVTLLQPDVLTAQVDTLASDPLVLKGLTVRALPPMRCPTRDDPEARVLWSAAARRYSHTPNTIGIQTTLTRYSAEVPRSELATIDQQRLRRGSLGTAARPRRVNSAHGYGMRLQVPDLDPAFALWRYLQLESHDAQHFIDESFGRYNRLHVLTRTPDQVVIAFCSKDLQATAVKTEGLLVLAPDSRLVAARWRFRTPAPREDVAGEVSFVPWKAGPDLPWLVPAEGVYWRKILGSKDQYFLRWERYDHWMPAPAGSTLHQRTY